MAKRVADSQITKDGSANSDDEDTRQTSLKALSEVMAKRKILKPRAKRQHPSNTFSGFAGGATNSFAGINGSSTNSFAGLNSTNNSFAGFAQGQEAKTTMDSSVKDNKVRALNEKFVESITRANVPGTVSNFTELAKKYIAYYEDIQKSDPKPTTEAKNGFAFLAQKKPEVEAPKPAEAAKTALSAKIEPIDVDSSSESEHETKIEGPKFTLSSKPTIKNAPFSFGPKPAKKKDDSDSESEVELKGPTFTFNKPIQDSIFKLNKSEGEPAKKFDFGTTTAPSTTNSTTVGENKDAPKPFSFGSVNKEAPKPFSFGSDNKEAPKPFSFGSDNKDAAKPSIGSDNAPKPFTFGAPSKSELKEEKNVPPIFLFGKADEPKTSTKPDEQEATKPAFSFGKKTEENTAPAFSFGKKDEDKPASDDAEKKKPAFSFGEKATPAFTFGKKDTDTEKAKSGDDEKKPFSFGSQESKPFSFGKQDSAQPFSFGKTDAAEKKDETPASKPFSFGEAKPFTFGKKDESASKPFSFGKSEDADKNTVSTTDKPSEGASKPFAFGQGLAFSFGDSKPSFLFLLKKPEKPAAEGNEENGPEEESTAQFKPVVKMGEKVESVPTGEEGEELKYTKRAKLMLYNTETKEYVNKGLGELKVLHNPETKKSRVLIRADGGMRTIFNSLISKSMVYSTMGNGLMVKMPVINEEKKLETYVLKVKTAEDGQDLLKALKEGQE